MNDSATLKMSGGKIAGSLVVGNPRGGISLSGGSFVCIQGHTTTEGKKNPGDLLADGYAFQSNSTDDLLLLKTLEGQGTTDNVTVVKCKHSYISINECPYCGSTVVMGEVKAIPHNSRLTP